VGKLDQEYWENGCIENVMEYDIFNLEGSNEYEDKRYSKDSDST
jgi:hypothetical protein